MKFDKQLSGQDGLWAWCAQEQSNAAEAQWASQEEEDLIQQGLTGEQLRTELLNRLKRRALVRGDHKLGLAVIKADQTEQSGKFQAEMEKAKLELARQGEERMQQQLVLERDKFQFDATKAALSKLDALKRIKTDSKLTEEEKLEQARLELFGVTPK